MADGPPASSAAALARMRRQARRDTKPEVALRKRLFAKGLRYRVDYKLLPGLRQRADIVFVKAKVAVFVHGCFWHACPVHGTQPRANAAWWAEKLTANVKRDELTRQRLEEAGWEVITVWEHDDPGVAADQIAQRVRQRA
ncbi:very short patch repair endonuclease [Geodermatophilus sp. SYSU D01062]